MSTASMSATPGARVPMTWEEYLQTPESPWIEYVDGAAVMSPVPSVAHAIAIAKLVETVQRALPPEYVALSHVGWKPGGDVWGPDVIVMPRDLREDWYTGIPPMIAEVLSTNRAHDLIEKVQKYARAGVPQYWIVDPRDREILGLVLEDGIYREYVRVDEDSPSGEFLIALGDGILVTLTYEQFFH